MTTTVTLGCAVPWNVASQTVRDGWRMAFAPGAFRESIRRGDGRLWVNHVQLAQPIADCATGTLYVEERVSGLWFHARIRDSRWAEVLRAAQANRRLRGCSVAWRNDIGERMPQKGVYLVKAADLDEISLIVGDREPWFSTCATVIEV